MIKASVEFTRPSPSTPPKIETGFAAKLAVTVLSASMVTEQVPDPEQSPLQWLKMYFG
jgi:hypothetical protein